MKLADALRRHAPDVYEEYVAHRLAHARRRPRRRRQPDGPIARLRSRTDPERSYLVRLEGGRLRCECPAATFRPGVGCAHVRALASLYGRSWDMDQPEKTRQARSVGQGAAPGGAR